MNKSRVQSTLLNLSTLWILLIILVVFSAFGNNFLSMSNASTILHQASFMILIGVAQMAAMLVGEINLSIGACMAVSTVICSAWLTQGSNVPVIVPILAVVAFAGVVGLFCGVLTAKVKIPAFLATYAVMYIARGSAWLIIGKGVVYGLREDIRFLANHELLRIGSFRLTVPMLVALVFVLIVGFVLNHTNFGRKLYFTGSNRVAGQFSGINTDLMVIAAHIFSGIIAGFAAVMYVGRLNAVDAALGGSYHFDAITVALIGGTLMRGGKGNVWEVTCGAIIVATIQAGMNNMKISSEMQDAFLGVLIIVAVFFNQFLENKKMALNQKS